VSRQRSTSLALYFITRTVQAVLLVFGVIVITFVLTRVIPGNVVLFLVGDASVSKQYIAQLSASIGLDKPLYVQLYIYIVGVLHGNLGYSYVYNEPVLTVILERLPATLLLVIPTMAISALLGTFLGVVASRKPYSLMDNVATVISTVGFSVPVFWLGEILVAVFAVWLHWLPVEGLYTARIQLHGLALYWDVLQHLVLPSATLVLVQLALITRLAKASMIGALSEDYIQWARAKGVKERTVLFKHALRNALLPVVTQVGYNFGFILTSAVLVEIVFAWPGLGRLLYDSVLELDYPTLTGILVVTSIMVIVANLLTDLSYALLDPRIRSR
jgi:peptide/nickel transport system permease protein